MGEQDRGNKPATIASKVSKLRASCTGLHRERLIAKNPMELIDVLRVVQPPPKFLSNDEIKAVREAAAGYIRREAMLETLHSSGMRVSGLVGLDYRDLNFTLKQATITHGNTLRSDTVDTGHRSIRTTQRYARTQVDESSAIIDESLSLRLWRCLA